MKIFDYIFYKITKAYFKLDGRTGATGIAGVTIVQCFLLADIFFFIVRLLKIVDLTPYSKIITSIASIVILGLFALNYHRYHQRYNKLRFLWKSETEFQSSLGGIFVFFSILLPPAIMILIVNSRW
ncbi:MAG TPA: hypothetical protein PLM56_11385 [Cyclobacteriaceae bacterium]|nr:hypothetical protein [Cyclobacteriaceae bacterium]